MNMKQYLSESSNPELAEAVVNQLGGWNEFKHSALDIANHSIDGEFSGFTYYEDTVTFAKKNWKYIEKLAQQQADDFGNDSIYEMFVGFRCMQGLRTGQIVNAIFKKSDDNHTTVMNCLAWYAGEEICREYMDMLENE